MSLPVLSFEFRSCGPDKEYGEETWYAENDEELRSRAYASIERALVQPQTAIRFISDHGVRLFYENYAQTIVGVSIVHFAMEEWFLRIGV